MWMLFPGNVFLAERATKCADENVETPGTAFRPYLL
jgi:hypothetical protein